LGIGAEGAAGVKIWRSAWRRNGVGGRRLAGLSEILRFVVRMT